VLFGLFGILLVGAAAFRRKAAALFAAAALGLTLFFILQDLSRLQPWFYQYSFMLAALCLYGWGRLGAEGALNACRLIMASIYFWSGLQKANASFVGEGYPWLVEPIAERLPTAGWWTDALLLGAYAAPAVEAGIGLGLLVPRFRTPAIVVALSLHAFILLCLGPWGHDWNTVVWPWNVTMGAFVLILFWRSPDEPSLLAVLKLERGPWLGTAFRAGALVLFAIMPILSFFGLWHSYLSSSLYSGNTKQGYLLTYDASGLKSMSISALSLKEMNVPAYPEKRVFKNVFADRCEEVGLPEPSLLVRGTPDIFSGERPEEVYRCDEVRHIS